MQVITTRYAGPTDRQGSQILARASNGQRLTYPIDNSRRVEDNHASAAQKLARRLGWRGKIQAGGMGRATVWVFIDEQTQIEV